MARLATVIFVSQDRASLALPFSQKNHIAIAISQGVLFESTAHHPRLSHLNLNFT